MRSLSDSFWKAVGNWASPRKRKPVIVVEATGCGCNWPQRVYKGTVESFKYGESLQFRLESGEIVPLDLTSCEVGAAEHLKPEKNSALGDWISAITFRLRCFSDDEEAGILEFTELRDFGETN